MLDEHRGDAQLLFHVEEVARHVLGLLLIEAGGGLVEQQQLRIGAQGADLSKGAFFVELITKLLGFGPQLIVTK